MNFKKMYSWQLYLIDSLLHFPGNNLINITRSWRVVRQMFDHTALLLKDHPDIIFEDVQLETQSGKWIRPPQPVPKVIIYYLHGGGFCLGSTTSHRSYLSYLSHITNIKVFANDYRLAPEHPFPAALDDCVAGYRWLTHHYPDHKIVIMGESAGGGLGLSSLLQINNLKLSPAAAAVLICPWLDLTLTGTSLHDNQASDHLIKIDNVRRAARMYYHNTAPDHPLISPLWGQLQDLPPLMVLASHSEILLSDSLRLKDRINQQGGHIQLELSPDMPHAWPYFAAVIPEARQALYKIKDFIMTSVVNI